jgi:limonene-1,2-epoxide hydrolase
MAMNGYSTSPAASVSVTPKAPVAPSPVVSLSGGKQVVTWTPTDLSATTVTVNGARVATSGNSVVVDNLQAGANTVAVTVENVYGVQTGSVTIDNGVKVSFTGTPSSIVAGDKVTFTGAVDSVKKADREVQLQTASDSGWKNVGSVVKTNAAGEFTLTATPASTTGYRVEVLTTAGATGAISSEKVVSVTPKPATAPKTIKATASASTTKPRAGQVVTLLNKAPGAPGNTQVTLQKLVGKSWKKVLVSKTTAAGNTAFRVKAVKGIQNYRIVVSGSTTTKMAISNTVKLTVR